MEVDDGPRLGGTAPLSPEANHRSLSIRPLRRRALASTNARPAWLPGRFSRTGQLRRR